MTQSKVNKSLYDSVIADSNIVSGDEYRELVCTIAQVASDMVVKTLGPYGSTTVIDEGTGFTYPSKDGWTCLNKMQFTDPTYNTIYNMLKKISFNSVTTVGDGTTTAMVAANHFIQELYYNFMNHLNEKNEPFRQATFIESMKYIYELLEKSLRNNPNIQRIDVDGDYSDIYKIAYIATNGNNEFASLIQEAYKTTHNPNIQVSLDKGATTTLEIQKGYKFDSRVLNYPAYVNSDAGIIDYKDHPCKIVIFDHNVTFQQHEKIIGGLSGIANRDNDEILILAPYFDDIVSSWIDSSVQRMVQNRQRPNIMLIQVPNTMNIHHKTLSDLCVLTNAQLFDEAKVKAFNILYHNQTHDADSQINDPMFNLEQYSFGSPEEVIQRCIGMVSSVIINKTEGFLQDYENIANPINYQAIMTEAEEDYLTAKKKAEKVIGGTLDKDFLFKQMRYIKLKGSTGVIRVGALSDIQQRCDKDTIDDAVLACKSAFEHGYVRGMNLEILSILNDWASPDSRMKFDTIPYGNDIIYMLFRAFYATSLEVIQNKHPDNNVYRRVKVKVNLYTTQEDAAMDTNKVEWMVSNYTNELALNAAISDFKNMYDYNLRTETMHPIGEWDVINSTATDIEILRAVINVLTTVITSSQFLSVTHRFDPKVHSERRLQNQMMEESRLVKNKINATIDAIVNHKDFNKLHEIFYQNLEFGPIYDCTQEVVNYRHDYTGDCPMDRGVYDISSDTTTEYRTDAFNLPPEEDKK